MQVTNHYTTRSWISVDNRLVDTGRKLNVHKTMYVQFTSCIYWEVILKKDRFIALQHKADFIDKSIKTLQFCKQAPIHFTDSGCSVKTRWLFLLTVMENRNSWAQDVNWTYIKISIIYVLCMFNLLPLYRRERSLEFKTWS